MLPKSLFVDFLAQDEENLLPHGAAKAWGEGGCWVNGDVEEGLQGLVTALSDFNLSGGCFGKKYAILYICLSIL